MDVDTIGGFSEARPDCRGCGQELVIENAWMTDGCPCNSALGVNSMNETRWRLLMELQQQQSRENEKLKQLAKQVAESNTMLRKILCHVAGRIAIKAKEDAGFATHVKAQWEDVKVDEAWVEFCLSERK